jgi:hypothetical protein
MVWLDRRNNRCASVNAQQVARGRSHLHLAVSPGISPLLTEASQDADLVCAQRRPAAFRIRGIVDPLAWRTRPKSAPSEGEHELFGFLTTEANSVVAPIHPKAMPVILTTRAGRRARRQMCALDVDGARGSQGGWSRTSHASVEPMNEAIGRPDDGRPRGTSSARDEPISEGWG